jgi:hypothetical protein
MDKLEEKFDTTEPDERNVVPRAAEFEDALANGVNREFAANEAKWAALRTSEDVSRAIAASKNGDEDASKALDTFIDQLIAEEAKRTVRPLQEILDERDLELPEPDEEHLKELLEEAGLRPAA